jgi:hypothetical protein
VDVVTSGVSVEVRGKFRFMFGLDVDVWFVTSWSEVGEFQKNFFDRARFARLIETLISGVKSW